MRLIDADALIAKMHDTILEDGEDRRIFYEVIERQHTIDPVKHGKWKVTPIYITCSECGDNFFLIPQNYCPNCGAKMEGGKIDNADTV